MRKVVLGSGATVIAVLLLAWSLRAFGPSSVRFAFTVVWLPMTWLGLLSRVVRPRLPASFHELRAFERSGVLYERMGVGVVKRLLRRGPLSWFNPRLHLPAEPTPVRLAQLAQAMRDAEASHALLLVMTTGIIAHAAVRGWWTAALATVAFDVAMNGYPVMLQRYNRALLQLRFGRIAA